MEHRFIMSVKDFLLQLESKVTKIKLVRFFILFPLRLTNLILWFWGRLRFSTLVLDRGVGCVCHWNTELKYPENLHLGDEVIIGVNVVLGAHSPIYMGNRVRISKGVQIETAKLDFLSPPPYQHQSKPIFIDEGVWIGTNSLILGGVRIGKNSIIGAGSVVTRDVPPRTLVVGVPAKVIKQLPSFNKEL